MKVNVEKNRNLQLLGAILLLAVAFFKKKTQLKELEFFCLTSHILTMPALENICISLELML